MSVRATVGRKNCVPAKSQLCVRFPFDVSVVVVDDDTAAMVDFSCAVLVVSVVDVVDGICTMVTSLSGALVVNVVDVVEELYVGRPCRQCR